MLQMFYLDIAKVDLNVAYTCMLQAYVLSVLRCFIRMFASVSYGFQMFFGCFRKCFIRLFQVFHLSFFMLQQLHLDILKVDRVLYMGCSWEAVGGSDNVRGGVGDVRSGASATSGALAREPNALDVRSLPMRAAFVC